MKTDIHELQKLVHAGKQLGAPTDHQVNRTALLEVRLSSLTNRTISHQGRLAASSSNATFHGPREEDR